MTRIGYPKYPCRIAIDPLYWPKFEAVVSATMPATESWSWSAGEVRIAQTASAIASPVPLSRGNAQRRTGLSSTGDETDTTSRFHYLANSAQVLLDLLGIIVQKYFSRFFLHFSSNIRQSVIGYGVCCLVPVLQARRDR